MELWIRSQDRKRLIKCEKLITVEFTDKAECEIWNDTVKLGTYTTKERALEVLDEIHNILQPKYILDTKSVIPNGEIYEKNGHTFQNYSGNVEIQQLNNYVYEMPEE